MAPRRRNRKQELLKLAQLTKTYIDSLNLKESDLVKTPIAAGVLGRHDVTLRAWRVDGRGPPYIKDPAGASVLYRVGALWAYAERNTHDPSTFSSEQKLLYMFSKSATAERTRRECDKHPDDFAPEVFEDEKAAASK
jgi:hypothetical protein